MLFCSPQFCLFFLVVFAIYWLLPWHRARVYLLLAASFFFYACWNHWLALLLCVSTVVDFGLARGMQATNEPRLRRLLLAISVLGNVGLLCYFKYTNFFLRSLEEAAGSFGMDVSLPVLKVMLPVGISFYTFEAINYTVDVYLRKIRAERNLANFMLFILFFPHLVAGPIVRARNFLPLVARRKRWNWMRAEVGVRLILMGLVKKLAIADRMALYVDPVFADAATYGTAALWLATIAYAIQIYCDFSGYSDMALGLAHQFGYHLAPNFDMPFLAANMTEFWRRWHMSLSSWIRDYVYIPLGGSRGSRWRISFNVVVAMTICGLWHGASWNYVVWGSINGCILVVHAMFKHWCLKRPLVVSTLQSRAGTALRVAATFACFCLTLVIFRLPDLGSAMSTLYRLVVPTAGVGMPWRLQGLYLTFAFVAVCHALAYRDVWLQLWQRTPLPLRGLSFGTALTLAMILAPGASKAFIYFQF